MTTMIARVIEAFEQLQICYCVLRDGESLEQSAAHGDVDFLIAPADFQQAAGALAALGFVRAPRMGYAPHHFFAGQDPQTQSWLKLDIVTDLRYGKPVPVLFTSLADACLQHRRRCGDVFVPSVEDELMTLLLHCILDKGQFAPRRWSRIQELSADVRDAAYLDMQLSRLWPAGTAWRTLAGLIETGDQRALLAMGQSLGAAMRRRTALRSFFTVYASRALRKLNRVTDKFQPPAVRPALQAIKRS